MTDKWKQCVDENGAHCEYNMLTGEVRHPIDKGRALTQEEVDELIDMFGNTTKPHIIPNDPTLELDLPEETCPDCKGTGEYTGALVVDICKRCNGIGQI